MVEEANKNSDSNFNDQKRKTNCSLDEKGKNEELIIDIPEGINTGQQIDNSEEQMKQILASSPNAITVTDLRGKIIECNQVAMDMHNYDCKEDLIGKSSVKFIAPEEREKAKKFAQKTLREGSLKDIEYTFITKDGKKFPGELSVSVLKNSSDNPIGFVSITKDISKRKKAEQEKEKLRQQLYQKQKLESIGTLAGGISHDFKNLLTVIMGMTDLVKDQIDSSRPIYSYLENILDSADKAADLIDQLLLFSRKKDTEFEILNLNTIIKNLQKMLDRLINENISVTNNLQENLWNIKADHSQIDQVLINLIINASDAMPGGGELYLTTKNIHINKSTSNEIKELEPGEYVLLEAEDTGQGMDQETQEKMFDPFFTTKSRQEGTGMGLSVVHGIVKTHNGFINVNSEIEKGTTFKIYFPIAKETLSQNDTNVKSHDISQYSGNNETILLVEDDKSVLRSIENILSDYNYNFYSAPNGKEALEIFRDLKDDINLLISDIVMPKINGIELAKTIQSNTSNINIILSSGYSNNQIEQEKLQELGYKFIKKPYNMEKLLKLIYNTLN